MGAKAIVTLAEPDLVESCIEVAVTVAVPAPEGANTPVEVIVPLVAVQVTPELKFPLPSTVAVHVLVWAGVMEDGVQTTLTEVIVGAAAMVRFAKPDLVASCVLFAMIVAWPPVGTVAGAVNSPEVVIVPASVDQVTAEPKLPVPVTVAMHWLVLPVWTLVGVQEMVTEVMFGEGSAAGLPLPPPQPATSNKPRERRASEAMQRIRALFQNEIVLGLTGTSVAQGRFA